MAQRVLMYPREWDDAAAETKGTETGKRSRRRRRNQKKLETSQRLLRKAAKEFKVLLLPIASTPQTTAATTGALTAEERHPLTNLLSLLHYNRVLFLPPSGLVLDSTPLDLLFTLPMEKPWLGLSAPSGQSAQPAVLLLEPSKQTYGDMVSSLPEGAYRDAEFLQRVPVTPAGADGEDTMALLAQTSGLENVDAQFNATGFLDRTAYVQLEDPTILGPEFDIPRQDFVRAMPSGRQARKAWEDVYKKYRDLRMEVCGLDLEPPPTVRGGEKEDSMNVKDLR